MIRSTHALVFVAVCVAAGCGSADPPPEKTPAAADPCANGESVLLCGRRLNIAHRGGGALAPEETLAAFQNAADLGVDVLELDVHSTADGTIICLHDDTVDRTTDGTGPVNGMTLEALRALDAGHPFSTDGGATFPFRGKGIVVPTLDEVLAAFPGRVFSIEIKQVEPPIVEAVLAVIDAHEAAERVVLASFFDEALAEVRTLRPDALTSFSLSEMLTFQGVTDDDEADYVPPARIVQAPKDSVTPELMARADRLGLAVEAWTVNGRSEMDRLLDLNVHGIMSDDPELLRQAIAEHASASK